jgi:hypothetical protein
MLDGVVEPVDVFDMGNVFLGKSIEHFFDLILIKGSSPLL